MVTIAVRATHPGYLDDEIVALTLQMDELNYREETKKAKYPLEDIPDLELAYSSYLNEIEAHLAFLQDIKLAHSIANAVDTDADIIAEITHGDQQAQDDHCMAVQMSTNDPELEKPPPYTQEARNDYIEDEIVRRLATMLTTEDDIYEDPQVEAGPSVPYARRQAVALEKLALEVFECTGCASEFRWTSTTQLSCGHGYCEPCLRRFIMAGVVDRELMLVPPRCCGTAVPFEVIACTLTEAEMDDFQHAELEKATKDKTYCSNPDCGRFIAPNNIRAGEATCPRCEIKTCAVCKATGHIGDCPEDPDIQATLELGAENNWQRCFSCRSLVEIEWGCNHMNCKCGAEFCYLCGTEWTTPRQCNCSFWIEENLIRRATQVVDRAAPANILPAERRRRIVQVQEQLRDTDECEHQGRKKFTKIEHGRFQCEMCNTRHKRFIMRCRRCQLDVCMDCRLHRV